MSDQPDKPEDGDSAANESATPEPDLLKADEVHLSDPDVSADAVEPTLSTSAEEVQLSEPSLEAAEISDDAAKAASLEEAAAEAELVAQEAEEVGTLVAGPRPTEDPADAAAPAGTAPAGGAAGDGTGKSGATGGSDATGGSGATDGSDATDETVDSESAPDSASEEAGASDAAVHEPDESEETDGSAGEDASAGLASFAVSSDDPGWTGTAQEQSRWDALFEAGQAGTTAETEDQRTAAQAAPEATEVPEAPRATDASDQAEATGSAEAVEATAVPEATEPAGGSAAPEAPWAQPFPSPQPHAPASPVPPIGGPYGLPPAAPDEPAPTRIRARSVGRSSRGSNRKKLIILGVIGLAVIALLIFAITAIVGALRSDDADAGSSPSTTPGADGIIAEGVSPLELGAGACILGFDSTDLSADVTTVTCTTPHNAQLLATTSLPEEAEFPGETALNASGDDLCNAVTIDENAAAEYTSLTLTQVTPTSGTWAEGDRRIDCFVVSDEDNITDTLLTE
ncbi:septum formation family protein [uncultured Arthrobacter sp.]|uniref:septum formation family protein n=1 Tax=uncultured Arthrobacter sp. TaxID=114050 RepID=UPI00260A2A98|nr:septum formation family protein [uncultured Arthrobacter sp.]